MAQTPPDVVASIAPSASSDADVRHWYVAASKPRKETIAEINLNAQGFRTFRPTIRRVVTKRGKAAAEYQSLFPGYLFVKFDRDLDRWEAINGTIGVQRLLCTNGRLPAAMPAAVMSEIFRRCPRGVWHVDPCQFSPGDHVTLTDGPFRGLSARFGELVSQDRVRVLMQLLDSEVPVIMPTGFLGSII